MLKIINVIGASLLISSCSLMPGMQNLQTAQMRKVSIQPKIEVHPILIPITPTLIADQKVSTYQYHVAPSDVLTVNVWQHPEFDFLIGPISAGGASSGGSGQQGYLVNPEGKIYFPLIGYVTVGGKTVDRIRVDITHRLKKYIPDPQLNVRVSEFRGQKVYVLGEVNKPGLLPINDQPLTIADALTLSGWLASDSAAPGSIYTIRGNYTEPQIFWLDASTPDKMLLAEKFSLRPGDVLYVSSAPITQLNRILSQLLPTVQTVWFTQSVIKNS